MKQDYLMLNATPKYFFNRITDITPEDLISMGAKAVAIDIDNTTFYDSTYKALDGVYQWVAKMRKANFPVVIVSNTYNFRAKILAKKLGNIPFLASTKKPAKEGFIEGAKLCGVDISQLAMIGDQLFTDILGANNAGAISVRVRYAKREIVLGLHYLLQRKREEKYLISKGLGDKI